MMTHEEREARHIAQANKAMKTKDGVVAVFFGAVVLVILATIAVGMYFG